MGLQESRQFWYAWKHANKLARVDTSAMLCCDGSAALPDEDCVIFLECKRDSQQQVARARRDF
jgi:hypothetical protein